MVLEFEKDNKCRTLTIMSKDGSPVAYLSHPGRLKDPVDSIIIPNSVLKELAEVFGYVRANGSS